MKKLILLISILFLAPYVYSQDNSNAKTILDAVSKQTKSYTSIEISFSYTMENKAKKLKEVKTGSAVLKGDKYYLNFSGQEVFCDGKTIWTYIKDNNEVQINNVNANDEQAFNPSQLLTDYSKKFTPKFIKEETRGAVIYQIIDLTPLKARSYIKIRLEIDKAKKQIANSIVYDKNGSTTYTYAITKFVTNKTFADSKFIFKKSDHPGVEEVDLR